MPLQNEEEKIQNADGNSTVPESLKNHLGDKSSDEAGQVAQQSQNLVAHAE